MEAMDTENLSDVSKKKIIYEKRLIIYNKYLPYYEKIEQEAIEYLKEIKLNLTKSLIYSDNDLLNWLNDFDRYLMLYGYFFDKNDFIYFIKYLFHLIYLPNQSLIFSYRCIILLCKLLRRRNILSIDDLTIDWRPLYEHYEHTVHSSKLFYGLKQLPDNYEQSLVMLVSLSKIYFPKTATIEILEQFRPLLCVYDSTSMQRGAKYLNCFLPTLFHSSLNINKFGYKLWLNEFLNIWCQCPCDVAGVRKWEQNFFLLFARLAWQNIGYIDWQPYMPRIFTQLLRSLNVYNKVQLGRKTSGFCINSAAKLLISMLGGKQTKMVIECISKLFKTIESFYHPSNSGKWNVKLATLLNRLSSFLVRRVKREKNCFDDKKINYDEKKFNDADNEKKFIKQQMKNVSFDENSELEELDDDDDDNDILFEDDIDEHPDENRSSSPSGEMRKFWYSKIPIESKLTEDEITQIVEILRPILLVSMFSKTNRSQQTFQYLSSIRPELIIPPLIENLYASLETLTEPHRLFNSMLSSTAVMRYMVKFNSNYNDGQSHVLPLLFSSLPGIDPNDVKKTMITFQFISTLVMLIPINDSSAIIEHSHIDLNENERELCLATKQFEDFVVQFTERCFNLIETYSYDHKSDRLDGQQIYDDDNMQISLEEDILDGSFRSVFSLVIAQSSPSIQLNIIKKVSAFISNRIINEKVAGKLISNMLRGFVISSTELSLKNFLPIFNEKICDLLTNEMLVCKERLDEQLLFNLLCFAGISDCVGNYLLEYKLIVKNLLRQCLQLKCKSGYMLATTIYSNILKSLTSLRILNIHSFDGDWNEYNDHSKSIPIRRWGEPGNLLNLDIKWHIPSDDAIQFANELINEHLTEQLNLIDSFINKEKEICRDELNKSLMIIFAVLQGAGSMLPLWTVNDSEEIKFDYCYGKDFIKETGLSATVKLTMIKTNENIRLVIAKKMHQLLDYVLMFNDDDVKSLKLIIRIIYLILFYFGLNRDEFLVNLKSYHLAKSSMVDKLAPNKEKYLRIVLLERLLAQHKLRLINLAYTTFTKLHLILLDDLFKLSLSHYAIVRKKSQEVLANLFSTYPFAQHLIVDRIENIFKNVGQHKHEEYKGALYMCMMKKSLQTPVIAAHNVDVINKLWLSLVRAEYSEKESIINLTSKIKLTIIKYTDCLYLTYNCDEKIREFAKKAWTFGIDINEKCPCPSENEINEHNQLIKRENEAKEIKFTNLMKELAQLIAEQKLHFRSNEFAYVLLIYSMQLSENFQKNFPLEGVKVIVNNLNDDTIFIRKQSINAVSALLEIFKRQRKQIDFKKIENKLTSNDWLQFKMNVDYLDEKIWNETIFVQKPYIGFYCYQNNSAMEIYQEHDFELSKFNSFTNFEMIIKDFFLNEQKLEKFIEFISIEEHKDKDKFNVKKFALFKSLYRNFGAFNFNVIEKFLTKLINDNTESKQRTAAEIITGLLRGSKYWCLSEMHTLRDFLLPMFNKILNNITTETINDWGTCFASAFSKRDGRKFSWLINSIIEDALKANSEQCLINSNQTSFHQASQLFCLLGILQQQQWRCLDILNTLSRYFLTENRLSISYQIVREKIGFLLATMFSFDVDIKNCCLPGTLNNSPKLDDIFNEILPKLELIKKSKLKNETANAGDDKINVDNDDGKNVNMNGILSTVNTTATDGACDQERKDAINILKITHSWLNAHYTTCSFQASTIFSRLLPVLFEMQNETEDEELRNESKNSITLISYALMTTENIKHVIDICKKIIKSKSWRAKKTLATFIQDFISVNLFTVTSEQCFVDELNDLIFTLLEDENIEVRVAAAETLSGLIHCDILQLNNNLIEKFSKKCSRSTKKLIDSAAISSVHAGILGLSAIVKASPYDVPEHLPDVLMILASHVNDPQPISTTVKTTLSNFRRTHYDNWRDHKLKFSEDQLTILTDLLISPSYYA